jgi:hypothetical protein
MTSRPRHRIVRRPSPIGLKRTRSRRLPSPSCSRNMPNKMPNKIKLLLGEQQGGRLIQELEQEQILREHCPIAAGAAPKGRIFRR